MSDYTPTTDFSAKDALPTGNANKLIKGSEMDPEFDNVATAIATKANKIAVPTANNVIEQDANGDLVDTGLATPTGAFVGTTDTQTLTNKTLTSPTINTATINTATITTPKVNGAVSLTATATELNALDADQAATTPTVTGSDAFVMDDADVGTVKVDIDNVDTYLSQTTKTLTNKTLTSPTLNSPTLTSPTLTSAVLNTAVSGTAVLDEDNMASNSATKLATQQSIKAYVDAVGSTYSPGQQIQVVNVQDGTTSTGTITIPLDNTIPQNTEGNQFMSLAITPTKSTNALRIDIVCHLGFDSGSASAMFAALFQDTTASAIAVGTAARNPATGAMTTVTFTHYMLAGTTSSTTFKVRAGTNDAGTVIFNGNTSGALFGGVLESSITITEIEV